MICSHQLALCKIHDCKACNFVGDENHCPFASIPAAIDAYPTFRQMFDIYRKEGTNRRRVDQTINSVRNDLKRLGLSEDAKSIEMTRTKFRTLYDMLTSPLQSGEKLRPLTISSHLSHFRALASEYLENKYNDAGYELPTFSIPKYRFERPPVQEVSDRTIRKVEIEMEKWLASGKSSDRDCFVFCFFALYCGMRAGDICEAKWDILRHTTAGIMLCYKPKKTLGSSGMPVSFTLDNKTYCKIEPLIGKPDEYVIPRHPDRAPRHVFKNGDLTGMHTYLRRKVNRVLSACGIGNEYKTQKKTHALRKYFETDRVMHFGRQEAARACGHSVEIQRKNYLGTMIGKVS